MIWSFVACTDGIWIEKSTTSFRISRIFLVRFCPLALLVYITDFNAIKSRLFLSTAGELTVRVVLYVRLNDLATVKVSSVGIKSHDELLRYNEIRDMIRSCSSAKSRISMTPSLFTSAAMILYGSVIVFEQ